MPITLSCPKCNHEANAKKDVLCSKCNSPMIALPVAIAKPPVISSDEKNGIKNDACSSEQAERDSAADIVTNKEGVTVADENIANPLSSKTIGETSGNSIDTSKPASQEKLDVVEAASTAKQPITTKATGYEPPSSDSGSILSELKPLLLELGDKLDSLTLDVDFAKKKQEQFDKLYEENRGYKDDIIGKFRDKLVQVVIGELDSADRQIKTFMEKGESEKTYASLLTAFTELVGDFRVMLANLGITAYKTSEGESLELKRHKIVQSEATGEKEKGKTIIRSVRYGYETEDGKILRPEFVDVYYYDANLNITAETPQAETEIPQNTNEQSNRIVSPVAETTEN